MVTRASSATTVQISSLGIRSQPSQWMPLKTIDFATGAVVGDATASAAGPKQRTHDDNVAFARAGSLREVAGQQRRTRTPDPNGKTPRRSGASRHAEVSAFDAAFAMFALVEALATTTRRETSETEECNRTRRWDRHEHVLRRA